MFYQLTLCLLLFSNYAFISDAEAILVTNDPPSKVIRAAGDTSYCVSITVGTTNMDTAMKNDAVATMLMAYRLSDVKSDQQTYFRINYKTLYTSFNWNVFENCGIYAVYTSSYINLSVTVTTTSSTTTTQLIVFATKP